VSHATACRASTLNEVGIRRRIDRLLPRHPAIWMPVDDSLLSGPNGGLQNLRTTISSACEANVDAILGFRGAFLHCEEILRDTAYVR
jgi:hypothetical protein